MKLSKIYFFIIALFSLSPSLQAMDSDEKLKSTHIKKRKIEILEKNNSSKKKRKILSYKQRRLTEINFRKAKEAKENSIGIDSREAVHNPTCLKFPWSAHGHMEIFFKSLKKGEYDKVYYGSGTMIGSKFVITAGHNLFVRDDTSDDRKHRNKFSPTPYKIIFYPGIDLYENSIKWVAKAEKALLPLTWHNLDLSAQQANKDDFGILVLDTEIGNETGFYAGLVPNEKFFEETDIHITGYPVDLPKKENGNVNTRLAGQVMYTASGKSHRQDPAHIYYKISTFKGNSGSATWWGPLKDEYYYVGIHTTGMTSENRAVLLNQEKIDLITQWMQDES